MEPSNPNGGPLPTIVFQQRLFVREELERRWEQRHQFVRSAAELEAFCRLLADDPRVLELGITRADADRILPFYNQVVDDGRYIWHLREEPEMVARELGIEVDPGTLDAVSRAARLTGVAQSNDITIAVAVVIVIVCAARTPEEQVVVDYLQNVSVTENPRL